MHVTERTDGLTKTLQDASRKLTFLNACEKGGIEMQKGTTRELCTEHNVYLPCPGCRADELESTGRPLLSGPATRRPEIERCARDATYERTEHESAVFRIWAAVRDAHEEES
jgi:hypothetical protein